MSNTDKKKASINQKSAVNSVPGSFDRQQRLSLITKIIFFGLIAAVAYNFIYQGIIQNKPYPQNTFLFLQKDRFNDLFNMAEWCRNMNPYFEPSFLGNSNYLPIANIFFWAFSLMPKTIALVLFTVIFSALIYLFSFISIPKTETTGNRHKYAFVITFLSYAYLFCFERANLEPYVVIPIMAFLFFYQKEKHQLAILFLAIAAATKIYPVIFILIYVGDKKYKEVALTIIYTVILVVAPLLLQKGGFDRNLGFMLTGFEVDVNTSSFVGAFEDTGNKMIQGSSLFSALKILSIKLSFTIKNMLGKYFILVALMALALVFYVVFIEKALWRKVTILTCMIIMLPHISFDYKLIHLLFCLYLFINESKTEVNPRLNYKTMAILLGLLLIPKSYFYFSKIITTTTGQSDVPMGTFVNPVLMLTVCILIVRAGLKYYQKPVLKVAVTDHLLAMKKSALYLLPAALIIVPYVMYSKKAKAEYSVYKEHYLKAQEMLKQNNTEGALAEFKNAFKYRKTRVMLPYQIASIYSQTGKPDSAIVYYNKILAIIPDSPEILNAVASLEVNGNNAKGMELMNAKNYAEALVYFTKTRDAFLKMPANPANNGFVTGLYSNICVCNMNLQKWVDAKNNLDQIAAIDPNNQFLTGNKAFVEKMLTGSATQTVK